MSYEAAAPKTASESEGHMAMSSSRDSDQKGWGHSFHHYPRGFCPKDQCLEQPQQLSSAVHFALTQPKELP